MGALLFLCLLDLAFSACATSSASPTPSKPVTKAACVGIMGQSNAEGLGIASRLPAALQSVNGQYFAQVSALVTPPNWITYGPGPVAALHYNNGDNFGPEVGIASDLGPAYPIQKIAVSGASLAYHWRADGVYPSATSNLAHQAFAVMKQRAAAWGCEHVYLVWVQGETDASKQADAAAYAANLAALAALERTYLPHTTWVVTRLDLAQEQSSLVVYGDTLRAQQAAFVSKDSDAILVDTDGAQTYGDHLHWNNAGLLDVGHRVAQAIQGAAAGATRR